MEAQAQVVVRVDRLARDFVVYLVAFTECQKRCFKNIVVRRKLDKILEKSERQ